MTDGSPHQVPRIVPWALRGIRLLRRRHDHGVAGGPKPKVPVSPWALAESIGYSHFAKVLRIHHNAQLGLLIGSCSGKQLRPGRNIFSMDLDQDPVSRSRVRHFSLLSGGSAKVFTPDGARGVSQWTHNPFNQASAQAIATTATPHWPLSHTAQNQNG